MDKTYLAPLFFCKVCMRLFLLTDGSTPIGLVKNQAERLLSCMTSGQCVLSITKSGFFFLYYISIFSNPIIIQTCK